MTKQARYISTSIPYVNSDPHVGFALELVLADAVARHARLAGYEVLLQGGTDDNSLKNVRAAETAGLGVADLVRANAARFLELSAALGVDFDEFVRTGSDDRHRQAVCKLWSHCSAAGDLYKRSYEGLYCVGCEQYYAESELEGGCCPEHGTRPETVREENWFFRLSRYGDFLRGEIERGDIEIVPVSRRNEVLSFLKGGLDDICVSRSAERARGWGIPVPGDDGEVIYVWFDALANYITGAGYGTDDQAFRDNWTDAASRAHVIGKGITRFHAVYWPAILKSAGLALPTRILVHGYLTVDGRKIGKSNGNGVDPFALVDRYGTDALRWYLLRHVRSTEDADFSEERLVAAHDGELADQLGNLVNRTLSVLRKKGGSVPAHPGDHTDFWHDGQRLRTRIDDAIGSFAVHEAAEAIYGYVAAANRYIVQAAPWSLIKRTDDPSAIAEADRTLAELFDAFRVVADALAPLLPVTSSRLREIVERADAGNAEPAILFPKLDRPLEG
ncbi:methionine--tRNA ligase [Pararhizobium sp. BT-229]|uniref:methionine--tRNA ligase n=1 Tax=Pararhizobium sp. BT-229 TaxID=2986923 RepID=UPI0021F6EE37|nr:methionine--tRNA ligase [Pararhizobium sp. BT-229]MCV9964117.1 methionine--tRNA ligase [Pararhizobium sp. BT-229]